MIGLCRFHLPELEPRLGLVQGEHVYDLTAAGDPRLESLEALLLVSLERPLDQFLSEIRWSHLPAFRWSELDRVPVRDEPHLLAPVDRQEVWAAGVTYAWSREARVREAHTKEIYVRVYEAERPELFFKALAEKVVGPHDWIGVRGDSSWTVPEPELAVVLNSRMEIVGYTVGNDVSSRDIEGENPLYLPQAKIYRHSCALGPLIVVACPGLDPLNLSIRMTITRADQTVFAGETSTTQMKRSPEELVAYLSRYNDFPHGAVLLTGTGIVPPDHFTLLDGDHVRIEISDIGVLCNSARQM